MDQNKHFFRVKSSQNAALILADKIIQRLKREAVLWLLSGGSAIEVAVECIKILSGQDLSELTVSLVDERYGPPGHADSNWQQLQDRGFDAQNAAIKPFLDGMAFDDTVREVNDFFSSAFKSDYYKIALLGLGADGHTAGILPSSPAISAADLVVGYRSHDYNRITLSLGGLKKLDEAFLYAVGDTKARQLELLSRGGIDPTVQPAQVIKSLPVWSVYNDRIGREI